MLCCMSLCRGILVAAWWQATDMILPYVGINSQITSDKLMSSSVATRDISRSRFFK